MSNNDIKVLELKEQIKTKKEELSKVKKSSYLTNLTINIDIPFSDKVWIKNLNTLSEDELKSLLVYLSLFSKEAESLSIWDIKVNGYVISDYISDIKSKLTELTTKQKMKQLKEMEDKLEKLLSEDKRKELEINELDNLLKWM